MNELLINKTTAFSETFGTTAEKLSFLREGLILEHIDYNDGYVLQRQLIKLFVLLSRKIIRINQNNC
jgi:galactokinase